MTDKKINKRKIEKLAREANLTEEQSTVRKFIIITLVLVILIVGIYFFTRAFVTKDLKKEEQKTEVNFDYTKTIIGSLLNRPYNEYYVLIYNSEDLKANYYYNLVASYQNNQNALKVYIADLNDEMNAKFYNKKQSNPNAKSINEIKVGDLTLIKVKDKQINKYIENIDDIKLELGL